MNKKSIAKLTTSLVALVLVLLMVITAVVSSFGGSTSSNASYINKVTDNIKTNFENYLDSSVAYKLPDNVRDTDKISVIIALSTDSVLDSYNKTDKKVSISEYSASGVGSKVQATVSSNKSSILSALDKNGIKYETGANYSTIISGFEIIIQAGDFEKASKLLGDNAKAVVGEVYKPCDTQLVENTVNVYEDTGIFNSKDFKYDGTGMVVAVLDTGLDYTHSAFSVDNFKADRKKLGLTKEMIVQLLASKETRAEQYMNGVTADDLYVNEKVPFAFDYADKDSDVYSLHNNHGTHVSGVIAGKDNVITGVAPNAQIVSMKTFSDIEDSARTSWILSALEDCVMLGVDVINMSLGTACGFSRESDKEAIDGNVYQKIRDAGISLVVAASNSYNSAYGSDKNGNLGLTSNPDTSTVGSPSTYDGAMSVASINGKKTPYILYDNKTIIYFVEATNAFSKEKDFFEEFLASRLPADSKSTVEVDYVVIPGAGRPADYLGVDVKDKIVLVRRGSNTFEEKAIAAQEAGAAGIIIYNNVSGDIKMNAGTIAIPICSISQDDGELLASKGSGKIKISRTQKSGPFMSDFSSWGPSPDLSIKPEITAHGGNILSAVTGGGYDSLSGTSMACPNMAGVIALLRQYVETEYSSISSIENDAERNQKINAFVNCLIMSTADIVYNTNGLPYAVRKQGAGLANLLKASTTQAYVETYDREDGSAMDKSKIELGDDPSKSGVYTLNFAINNFGTTELTYNLSAIVMTEGVSDTETSRGQTTVDEEGYLLSGAKFELVSVTNGTQSGTSVTVPAGSKATIKAKITLSDEDKQYLNESFENGMYVEGFVKMTATKGTSVNLSVPYLAFYGDWTQAPIFDLDYFETNKDELDDGVSPEDKIMADAYPTRPIGGLSSDYVSYLGSYYFVQNPENKVISASRDYVALSYADDTVHALRFVWAGLLRNAEKIVITITDAQTGEQIFEKVDNDVRKSYGDGGSIYPANVEIEFDTQDYNLKNNTKYNVKLEAYMDYGDGGKDTNLKNTFEFPFVVDFEAPTLTGCEYYTEYDKDAKKTRLFAKMAIYDNHYSMAMNVGYVAKATEEEKQEGYESVLKSFESYLTPIYSKCNGTTYVEYELTDYIYDIKENAKNKNTFVVTCYDYALNTVTYEIALPDEYIDFFFEESSRETTYLSPNQVYRLNPVVYPNEETDAENPNNPWKELLSYNVVDENVARIVNDKLVAIAPGETTVQVKDFKTGKATSFSITVVDSTHPSYKKYDKPVADVFSITGYETLKAYYYLSTDEREIGATGDIRMFGKEGFSLSMFPSESVELITNLVSYFPDETTISFTSNNQNIVKVDDKGVITAQAEGFSSITVKVLMNGKSTLFSQTINVSVKDPFITTGPSLTHYFGLGGEVTFPEVLTLTEIGNYAFSNFDYIPKTEDDEISEEAPDATKIWYLGDNTITKVVLPVGIEKIGAFAFANLTALEEIVVPYTLEAIEYGAFFGCTKLRTISYMDENGNITSNGLKNVKLINKSAFQGCNLRGTISFENACAIGDYAFAYNTRLSEVVFPKTLQSIGASAFEGNTSLSKVTVNAETVKYGAYVFSGCTSLTTIQTFDSNGVASSTINSAVIPAGAFYRCRSLDTMTIGKDVNVIGEYAFTGTKISSFNIHKDNKAFYVEDGNNYILSSDQSQLIVVSPLASKEFKLENTLITTVGVGAFVGNNNITSVVLPNVTTVLNYAFAECEKLESVQLGALVSVGDYSFFDTPLKAHPSFDAIRSIGDYAFAYTKIENVSIPNGVTVGEGAFCELDTLQTVQIGNDVTIGLGAFMYNNRLEGRWQVKYYIKNAKRHYYYDYISPIKSITIGNNVVIGNSAFMGCADIEEITLGTEGVVIGDQAFYNSPSLKIVNNLDKVTSIGARAFSGDQQAVFSDVNTQYQMVTNNQYVYHYYGSAFTEIQLTNATSIGYGAFAYCNNLVKVTLGNELKSIDELAFFECTALQEINLDGVESIGREAFANTIALKNVNLSSLKTLGNYAFVYSGLEAVTLSANGTDIKEGSFAYCDSLSTVNGIEKVKEIGDYAFAYSGITSVDLSSAVSIGDNAFMKESLTDLTVKLGSSLEKLGDNPFAYCRLTPFTTTVVKEINGKPYESLTYDFDLSENVKVVNGSLYCKVPYGYELITYVNTGERLFVVMDGTVRVSAYAFAGTEVERVELPLSLNSIGHKAFYDCDKLQTIVFKSYDAPILEEELDINYYNTYDNLPATGEFGFENYDGSIITKQGLGIVDYFMWNVPSGLYYDVYFGANFLDNIGHLDRQLVMIRPSNGQYYETFIYAQYFDTVVDGTIAPTDITLEAIEAINQLPNTVRLSHESLVIAARKAYDKVATRDQQALVTNYTKLVSAENRIKLLKGDTGSTPDTDPDTTPDTIPDTTPDTTPDSVVDSTLDSTVDSGLGNEAPSNMDGGKLALLIIVIVEAVIIAGGVVFFFVYKKEKLNIGNGNTSKGKEASLEADDKNDTEKDAE